MTIDEESTPDDIIPAASGEQGDLNVAGSVLPDFSKLGLEAEEPPAKPEEATEGVRPAEEAKKPEEAKPESKKQDSKPQPEAEKPKADAEKTEKKPDESKKEAKKLPDDDKDLDAIQPKPGAGPKVITDFAAMRTAAKEARNEARSIAKERDELAAKLAETEKTAGKLNPEIEKELADLRAMRLAVEGENDPVFQSEWTEKQKKAGDAILSTLKKGGLPEDVLKEVEEQGVEGWKRWADLEKLLADAGDNLTLQQIRNQRLAFRQVAEDKAARAEQIRADPNGWVAQQQKQDQDKLSQWQDEARKTAEEVTTKYGDMLLMQSIPDGATATQKKAIEEHNARVTEIGTNTREVVGKIYSRDPRAVIETAIQAQRATLLEQQLADANEQSDTKDARIKELEDKIAGVKKAGRIAHSDTADATQKKPDSNKIGGDASEAFNAFFDKR